MTPEDAFYMARALRLAARGLYSTRPNPRVGCVLVKGGRILGEGFHRRAGEPHAERNALAEAGMEARSATAYVTLEPCCHHGRTPPCTEGLIEAGVKRVVLAMRDPNPLVAGQGEARLREAGIAVDSGVLAAEARALNPGFAKRMQQGLPYVRCKLAMSLDGRTAMASGESQWITEEPARKDVHRLRARSEAVLTGIGTVQADDPSLNVRLKPDEIPGLEGEPPQPLRAVMDSGLRMSPGARMLTLPGGTLILTRPDPRHDARSALEAAGAEVRALKGRDNRVDLKAALHELAGRGINEVLIESGPTLAGAAIAQGLVDELVVYLAPHLMGDEGRGLLRIPGLERMADRIDLEWQDVRQVGADLRLTLRPRQPG